MRKYPQELVNVRLTAGFDVDNNIDVMDAVRQAEADLGSRGRGRLRKSGTEPVVRVMVEGQNSREISQVATAFAGVVEQAVAESSVSIACYRDQT